MIGRTDDWVKAANKRDGITVDPAAPDWAGIAVFKRAAAIYQERGYRTRLLDVKNRVLERRVAERTRDLTQANAQLQLEITATAGE